MAFHVTFSTLMRMENDHGVKEMRHEREVPNKLLARDI